MKKLLLLTASMFLLPLGAWADPCVVDTMADYTALGSTGCTIGTLLFSNFSYGVPGNSLAAADVTVTPITTPNPGLMFGGPWVSNAGASFSYLISVLPGGGLLVSHTVTLGQFTVTGTGSIFLVSEPFPCNDVGIGAPSGPAPNTSSCLLATSSSEIPFLAVNSGSSGFAQLSAFDFTYTQTPEPGTLALLGGGLLALAWGIRLRLKTAQ